MRSLLLFLCLFLSGTKGAEVLDPTVPFMVYLDQDHLVCLKWGFDNPQGNITFKLVVNTTGWVGFGLSPNGGMPGSDIVIGGLGPDGSYFSDRHAIGMSMPLVDAKQSYTLLSLKESDGQTIMTFRRSIVACDDKDFHITAQPIKLIYAYGTTDEISYHGSKRGTKEVNLLNYMPSSSRQSNPTYLSARVNNVTIPTIHTYYHCKVLKFANLTTKYHIYKIEPVIEHHDIVHHMILYSCPSFVKQPYEKPCFMGDVGDACFAVMAAWGVGGGVYEFPDNTGIPIGGEDNDTFYRLEIHYNNPQLEAGRTDSSGLRLHYTVPDNQRQDVGILTVGVLPFGRVQYDIPPRTPQFRTYGVCNTTLIPALVNPVPDLKVFSVLLHTHLAGRKVRVGQYRGEKQIDFLGVDENYMFDIQQTVNFGNIKTIKQGDEIAVECTYSTVNRTGITKMGLATTDEMCLAFIMYYPAIPISSCLSYPNAKLNTSFLVSSTDDEIADYQSLLMNLSQIQLVSDHEDNYNYYINGTIRAMMETPTVTCGSSRPWTPWVRIISAGITVLLLLIAIMLH